MATASDPTPGGAEGITKELVVDHAVLAGTPGAESPCVESTCQYFVPGGREVTDQCAPVIWLLIYWIFWKPGSPAISRTYPDGCGLGTSVQVIVTGSVTVAPLAGERSVGGGGRGAL